MVFGARGNREVNDLVLSRVRKGYHSCPTVLMLQIRIGGLQKICNPDHDKYFKLNLLKLNGSSPTFEFRYVVELTIVNTVAPVIITKFRGGCSLC